MKHFKCSKFFRREISEQRGRREESFNISFDDSLLLRIQLRVVHPHLAGFMHSRAILMKIEFSSVHRLPNPDAQSRPALRSSSSYAVLMACVHVSTASA